MIRSLLSNDDQEELVNSARANVGLFADTIWAPLHRQDPYRKLNRDLWIRSCKIAANYDEISAGARPKKKRVRDVIPESRLASYGDFEYGDEAELLQMLHPQHEPVRQQIKAENGIANASSDCDASCKQPWMLKEVDEYVTWVTSTWDSTGPPPESSSKSDEKSKDMQSSHSTGTSIQEDKGERSQWEDEVPARFNVTNVSEAQLEGRIFSESVRKVWREPSPVATAAATQQQQQQQQPSRAFRRCQNELQRELSLILKPRASPPPSRDIQQTHSSFQNERLKIPSRCQYSYVQSMNMAHRGMAPLCVDVPEFFPKAPASWPSDEHAKPLQSFYPTSAVPNTDNPYQDELFPYKGHLAPRKTVALYQNTVVPMVATPMVSAMVWPSQPWAQRIVPTPIQIHHQLAAPSMAATIQATMSLPAPAPAPVPPPMHPPQLVHRPIRIQETAAVASSAGAAGSTSTAKPHSSKGCQGAQLYQRLNKSSHDFNQRRKSQGVDFNNLILLTKSAMKLRRNQTKAAKKYFVAEATKPQANAAKPDPSSSRWFDKSTIPKREREYVTVSTTAVAPRVHGKELSQEASSCSTRASTEELASTGGESQASFKRAYGQPGENSPLLPPPLAEDSSFERRYDELERQAMEQYRTSEECLALRYQELEQQAMEQYKNVESSESVNANFEDQSAEFRIENEAVNRVLEGHVSSGSCDYPSGFGSCNPVRKNRATVDAKGNELQQQQQQQRIRILKPESQSRRVERVASEGSIRPHLSAALPRRPSYAPIQARHESKNTLRGASGDKIVRTSSLTSLKRRLMPMSPMERNKSGANLMKNVSLDPIKAVQNLDKHIAAHYRNTRVLQKGSGDDKTNNAGVWLSDFWS